jgi:nucleotide-binding universal stress UspA family protein
MEAPVLPSGSLVVGIDGSASADRALDWATEQAAREHRPLVLAHGLDPGTALWTDGDGAIPRGVLDDLRLHADRLLQHARERVAARAREVEIFETLSDQDARAVLLHLGERAAMVVVGSRGRGPVRSLLLGSVSLAVSRHAECPVVIVRPGDSPDVGRGVLVGAGSCDAGVAAVDFAYRQASLRDLPLTVVRAYWDARPDVVDEDVRLEVAEILGGFSERFPDVHPRVRLERGLADRVLIKASRDMDLTVVGRSHRRGLAELARGSVASTVVEHADGPVAVVPGIS